MSTTISNPLYVAFKSIKEESLREEDKEELLRFFKSTKNALIRDHIAMIFADIRYDQAVPDIVNKIKVVPNNCGTLIFALDSLDSKKFFLEFIKIICNYNYEPRLMALNIIEKYASEVSTQIRNRALRYLENSRLDLERTATEKGENSTLHFVEQTIKLLQNQSHKIL